ncbi:MAG: phosphate uptake regulator PhoU [Acidobacteriia bacterium]|nr:phosphate uptake regulator PhoU [Terriglobia bacterium]
MSTAEKLPSASSMYAEFLEMTLAACELARKSAAAIADALASKSPAGFAQIAEYERQLDLIDREIDERVSYAVTLVDCGNARELLVCMKFLIDLERIGDLLCSAASRAQVLDDTVDMADLKDLIEMATVLEAMLRDAYAGLAGRNVDIAVRIVRADAEIDRHRNLLFFRLLDGASTATRNAVHMLFIANELERAGDHAVNLGEEICHIVTGHTIRHVRREADKSDEQRYLDFLRGKGTATNARANGVSQK